jgi:hypothetical protein
LTDFSRLVTNLHSDVSTSTRAQAYGLGDMTNDLAVNFADFVAFRTAYNMVHGAGAFEAATGIPEPAAATLLMLGSALWMYVRRRRAATVRNLDAQHDCNSIGLHVCFRRSTLMVRMSSVVLAAVTPMLVLAANVNAQLVSNWGLETGQAGATLTEGAEGSFSTTIPTGNAGPRALLPSPVNLTDVGDILQFSGTVSMSNAPGNQQLRWGIFNTNGHATGTLGSGLWTGADATGWLGYMTQLGGGNGNDRIAGRDGTSGGGVWLSNTNAYQVGAGPGAQPSVAANTPYNFTLKLTRTGATTVKTDYTFVGGTVNRSGSFVDNVGASAGVTSYDAVGFLLNGNTGSGTFSNISVTIPKELRLRVNMTTGGVTVVNGTDTPLAINYYEIRSATGALNLAGWNSFDDQEGTDPIGTGWDEAGGSSGSILSEVNLLSSTSLAAASSLGLGSAFTAGGTQDLVFSYSLPNQSALTTAFVEYVSGGVPGDYNEKNIVDTADYAVWRKNVGAASIPNRGAGIVGNVGPADYDFWRAHFGAVTGSGAASAIGAATVPESATVALAVLVLASLLPRMRRRAATEPLVRP